MEDKSPAIMAGLFFGVNKYSGVELNEMKPNNMGEERREGCRERMRYRRADAAGG